MSDLTLNLDTTTFEQLVELARALIPGRAPQWTDHNVHDPGITLLELIAWNAEAQIYSLGRSRRDERMAYAGLVGVHAHGPQPARGLIWPNASRTADAGSLPWARGTAVTRGDSARNDREGAPEFAVAADILLVDATLVRVSVIDAAGEVQDVPLGNRQDGAEFRPFGADGSSLLRLSLKGTLATPLDTDARASKISFGVEVPNSAAIELPRSERSTAHTPFTATLVHGPRRHALPVVFDGTRGLLRSGVLLLSVAGIDTPIDSDFAIELAPLATRLVRAPSMTRIAPNVLPVTGERALTRVPLTTSAHGLADQTYALLEPGLMFGAGVADPTVTVDDGYTSLRWELTERLGECGPDDRRFTLDRERGSVRFGNGVNGSIPKPGAVISATYRVSSGIRGNLPRRLRWRIRGIAGFFGENPIAMSGGTDAATLDDLKREARRKLLSDRPVVTSTDLQAAALALEDLGVARAQEMRAADSAAPGVRTLVVLAAGREPERPETAVWLAAIHSRLKGRLPLGQRLRVVAPDYVTVAIKASAMAQAQANRAEIRRDIEQELRRRFALVATRAGQATWEFEREVTTRQLQGWLRCVASVAAVTSLTLTRNGEPVADGIVRIQRHELPRLSLATNDIVVLPFGVST